MIKGAYSLCLFQNNLSFTFFTDKQFVLHIKSVQLVLTFYTVEMGLSFVLANHNA